MSKIIWITIGCAFVVVWFIVMVVDAAQTKEGKYSGLENPDPKDKNESLPTDEKALQQEIAKQVSTIRSTWAFMKNDTRMAVTLESLRFWILLLLLPFVLILFFAFHKVFRAFKTSTVTAMAMAMGGIVTGICLFIWIQAARRNYA